MNMFRINFNNTSKHLLTIAKDRISYKPKNNVIDPEVELFFRNISDKLLNKYPVTLRGHYDGDKINLRSGSGNISINCYKNGNIKTILKKCKICGSTENISSLNVVPKFLHIKDKTKIDVCKNHQKQIYHHQDSIFRNMPKNISPKLYFKSNLSKYLLRKQSLIILPETTYDYNLEIA